jgi:hypothetical protein
VDCILRRADPLGVERVEVDRGPDRQLLDLTLAQCQPGPLPHLPGGMLKRAGRGLDRREAPDPVRRALLRHVQRAVGDIEVLLAALTVCQSADRHLPEHARQRTAVIALHRPALDPLPVSDPVQPLLATGAQIEMILKQATQQLPPDRQQLGLKLPMLQDRRVLSAQPADDPLKPFPRAAKRILASATTRREIPCSRLSAALSLQEFISRRVKFATAGAGVGDHVAHLSWSTLVLATPTSASPPPSPATYGPGASKPARNDRSLPAHGRDSPTETSADHPSTRAAPESFHWYTPSVVSTGS